MAKSQKAATAAKANPRPAPLDVEPWERWTIQLPRELVWALKVRAAQEHRNIRETVRAAVEAYLETPVVEGAG